MVKKSDFLGRKVGFSGVKNRIFWGRKSDFLGEISSSKFKIKTSKFKIKKCEE
jgi:hypothetical protein